MLCICPSQCRQIQLGRQREPPEATRWEVDSGKFLPGQQGPRADLSVSSSPPDPWMGSRWTSKGASHASLPPRPPVGKARHFTPDWTAKTRRTIGGWHVGARKPADSDLIRVHCRLGTPYSGDMRCGPPSRLGLANS